MQIKSLVIYNSKGEKRILPFELNKVNIITGESKTGKTALIDIINYCLGSKECYVAEGIIREKVEWFAIILQLETEQIFIARQNPSKLNLKSTENIYFSNSDTIEIPDIHDLRNNSDIKDLNGLLKNKLFFSEYTHEPETGTRAPLDITFRHSLAYSFQPQDQIAQRNSLFYNQSDNWVAQAIKDTLPYFLGVIREDIFNIEQKISEKKRELNRCMRQLRDNTQLKDEGNTIRLSLINEAKELGLLDTTRVISTEKESVEAMQEILLWESNMNEVSQAENENLEKLINEINLLKKELSELKANLSSAEMYQDNIINYSAEVSQQKVRLESIKLFKDKNANLHSCPLCSQFLETEIPSITAINTSLKELTENLETTIVERPNLNNYIKNLSLKKENLKKEIDDRFISIKAIYVEQEQAAKLRDINIRKGKVLGKITLFLASYKSVEEDQTLQEKIKVLETEIRSLEELISSEEKEIRLNAILNQINTQMSVWSSELDVEYQDASLRFDIKKLTIFADTPTKSIPLTHMGSGANWVAYHLLIHFALHKHFVKAERPVPRFLILDQPSQIYFPPEKDNFPEEVMQKRSTDEDAIKQMYEFIFMATKILQPHFQVIITDHANLVNDEFNSSIIEEWRDGLKLIPNDW